MRIRRHLKKFSVLALAIFLNQIAFPTYVLALTGGPTQPEVHGFEPVGTNQMVDLFSGDFSYNVPLFEIGGYPINMAYHSGVGMEQEASWVGLGWSLTPGAINRNLKGLPDDFKGDDVKFMRKMKPNTTIGLDLKLDPEVFGFELSDKAEKLLGGSQSLSLGVGVTYNGYTGVDINKSVNVTFSNGLINPSIGYSDNSGLSLSAHPNMAAVMKNKENNAQKGTKFLGKLSSFVKTDGEISWSSESGLSASVSGLPNYWKMRLAKLSSVGTLSAAIETNDKQYSPGSDVSMWNYGMRLNVGLGKEVFGGDAQGQADFFFNTQRLGPFGDEFAGLSNVSKWSLDAYGTQYAHESEEKHKNDLLDFNREHEYALRDESPLLPITQLTYDVFSISGQGTGGSFRNYRNDFPLVGKNRVTDMPNTQRDVGLDIAEVSLIKLGGNISVSFGYSRNGFWKNGAAGKIGFVGEPDKADDILFEPTYFKRGGEFGAFEQEYLDDLGGEDAVRFNLTSTITANNELKTDDTDKGLLTNADFQKDRNYDRASRATAILSLTKEEAYDYGFPFAKDKKQLTVVKDYTGTNHDQTLEDGVGYATSTNLNRLHDMAGESHHYGEFQITQDNGYTYVYGLPAYNHQTVETSFAIEAQTTDLNNAIDQGYVDYDPTTDPKEGNDNGQDNFVSRKEIGSYPHSFLLTQILSPDYVDVMGDGVTDDDIGEAVIFNYEKVHDEYGWRNPMASSPNKARYIEGLNTRGDDDKASYVYGTKEIWVLHSIESRNMVAEFITSDREDSYGAANEEGLLDMTKSQKRLDRIELYNKIDRSRASTANGYKAKPTKVIHLNYDYSLCQGVPNSSNNGGKLTLTELAFSYGNSGMGLLNPYKFSYSNTNPDYNPLEADRWGNYMSFNSDHPNQEFSYVNQDKGLTDQYASAWLLDKIELPSGGEINVQYESDDYAYVMEKNALSMVDIAGVGKTRDFTAGNKLFDAYGKESNFLYFKLPTGTYDNDEDVRSDFKPEGALYFKALFHVKDKGAYDSDDKEYVSGYVKIKDVGLCPWTSGEKYGFVEIEEKRDKSFKYQAMSHAAWKFMLSGLSERVNDAEPPVGDLAAVGKDYILSNLSKITKLLKGQIGKMKTDKYAQYIDLEKSIIRLKEPSGFKLGGGCRVKQISMNDGWDQMTGTAENSSEYGTVYSYTKMRGDDEISSGVASYEPMMGSEENPYKQPIYYKYRPKSIMGLVKVGREIEEYVVGPYGEMYFPGAGVGYSEVKVQSLATKNMTGSPTGYTINEFYTAKDFPVIQDKTIPQTRTNALVNNLTRKFTGNDQTNLAMSQGYSFILNDMHGKPKKTTSHNQLGKPISSQKFVYKTDAIDSRRLDNHVDILHKSGLIENNKQIGVEVDFVADAHESINRTFKTRMQPGVDGFSLGIPPFIAIPNLWFELKSSASNLRYISNTKVIYKYGILDRVVATDERSVVTTKNLLWDAETGQVLLTRAQNEFENDIENFSIPAHMTYSGMEGAYKNLNLQLENVNVDQGKVIITAGEADEYFEPGDEIILGYEFTEENVSYTKAWVLDIKDNDPGDDEIFLIDKLGKPISPLGQTEYAEFRILRSGKRNQTSAAILSVTSLGNITNQINSDLIDDALNVSSLEFSDEWGTYCDRMVGEVCPVTDDLRLVFNCLWGKANTASAYSDIGINLEQECDLDLRTDVEEQAKNMSDFTVKVKSSTSRFYHKDQFIYPAPATALQDIQDDILARKGIDFNIETIYDNGTPPSITEYIITTGSFTDEIVFLTGVFDTRVGSGNYTYTDLEEDEYIDEEMLAIDKMKAPWFTLLTPDPNTPNEILIGVGGLDIWEDINGTLDRDAQMPVVPSCTLKLIPPPNTTVSASQISEFTGMTFDGQTYTLTATMSDLVAFPSGTLNFTLENSCLDLTWCENEYVCGPVQQGFVMNPYVYGVRGNWRPKNTFSYHTNRSTSVVTGTSNVHTDIRKDGELEGFSLDIFNTDDAAFTISGDRWISPATVTEYTPDGSEIENMDALGRYSSEIFGYDRRVVIAAANNAPHHNIAFDGFEEYTYPYHGNCRKKMHWAMTQYVEAQVSTIEPSPLPLSEMYSLIDPSGYGPQDAVISDDEAHTGHYSLKMEQGEAPVIFYSEDLIKEECTSSAQQAMSSFQLYNCDCIGVFEPDADSRFYFSAWVKEAQSPQPENYTNTTISIKVYDDQSNLIYTKQFEPAGPITEGWQRVAGDFDIPANGVTIRTEVEVLDPSSIGASSIDAAYVDDMRIQPFNSQMNTYVYNHQNLRMMAELDANNYATFYEYDEEGRLLRIKKETEKGIMTIQESRYGISQ